MSQSKQKILIIDDAPDNIAMLRNTLHPDYKVFFSLSGAEALEWVASTNKPDLILLDILMPEMDGFEVCRRLKASPESQEIPVIFITAKNEAEIETKGLELGAVDFITKPFNPPVVRARVKTHLKLVQTFAELKEREHHLRSILEAAMDAIITTDEHGVVLDFNPFAETLFGYPKQVAIGKNITDMIVPPHLRVQHQESLKRYAQLARINQAPPLKRRLEISGLCANGKMINLEMALVATRRHNELCFTAFLHDITERNNLLKSLNDMLKTAEDASRAKSDFLANMSHEIRTPMNAIIGLTNLALKTELSPKMLDYLTKIDNASHSMLGIINDILEYSKIEAGHMQLNCNPFGLQEVFDHLGDLFRRLAIDKGVELIFSIPADETRLIGDAMRLEQVLTNLISNAIKFTNEGEILVEALIQGEDQEQIKIEFAVHDTGIGIDPKRLPDLFESFVQADSSITRKYGGTGLGLAISKRIVGFMGGEIWAESQPGHGSVFRFTAFFKPSPQDLKIRWQMPPAIGSLKVLLVDTNKNSREVLTGILRGFNLETTAVDSLTQAAFLLISNSEVGTPYRLVLLNLRNNMQEGVKVYANIIKTLAAETTAPHLPKAILLTNTMPDVQCEPILDFGIHACVEKPVNRSQLFNTILEIFGFDAIRNSTYANQERLQEGHIRKRIGGSRILVVEDNAINMQVIKELLERVGLIVEEANNGKKALSLLNTRTYVAVLMDLQMPEMDGFTATRLIRGDVRFQKLPIIAMTAHAMEEDRQKCLEAGMNGHVGKPFEPKELYDMLTRWIDLDPPQEVVAKWIKPAAVEGFNLPGLNMQEGLMRLGGDVTLYHRLLLRFRTDHAEDGDKIATALRTGERALAERLAHTIKSIAGQLGAESLYQVAASLEQGIAKQEGQENRLLVEFKTALDEIVGSVARLHVAPALVASACQVRKELDLGQVAGHARTLAFLLTEQDSKADTLLPPLRLLLAGHATEKMLENIAKALKQYDYVQALNALVDLTQQLGIARNLLDGNLRDDGIPHV